MSESFDRLVSPAIRELNPYQPGKPIEELERELGISGAIKLASNENPLGPSPRAIEAVRERLDAIHYYPDGGAYTLRHRLADELGVSPARLIFGGGSNELVDLLIRTFCTPGRHEVLAHRNSFICYRLLTVAFGCTFVESGVTSDLACDVDDLIAHITDRTRIILLANPNNPTGSYVPVREFERLLEAVPEDVLFVVDEAYHEYAVRAVQDYPRAQDYMDESRPLIVNLRTFSKIYGLAGLRIGYGLCDARVASFVNRVRRPFNVNSMAQVAAQAALDDTAYVEESSRVALESIATLSAAAERLGIRAYPSAANFVLLDVGDAPQVHDSLSRDGVIVRPMTMWGLPRCLRVSVGTAEQTERACRALEAAIKAR